MYFTIHNTDTSEIGPDLNEKFFFNVWTYLSSLVYKQLPHLVILTVCAGESLHHKQLS